MRAGRRVPHPAITKKPFAVRRVSKGFGATSARYRKRAGDVGEMQTTVDARTANELMNKTGIETVSRTNRINRRDG